MERLNENYEELKNAIVLQSVEDYQSSAVKIFELVNTEDPWEIKARDKKRAKISMLIRRMNDAKRFLLSEDLKVFTDIKGTDILNQLDKNILKEIGELKIKIENQRKEQEEYTLGFYSTLDERLKNLLV